MTSADGPLIATLVVLFILAVYLAVAETAILRISEVKARSMVEAGNRRAVRLLGLVERLPQVLNLILFLALLAQIGTATLTGILADRWFGTLGITIASVLLTIILYIYGEAIPKTYAVRHAEHMAILVAPSIAVIERVFRPLVRLLVWVADIQLPGKGISTTATVTEGELRLLAIEAADEGAITQVDRDLIDRVFRFGDRRVDDIMVPRPDIIAAPLDTTVAAALEIALEAGHRRLPLYTESLDNIESVVRLRELIAAREDPDVSLGDLAYEPLVVPETKSVTGLLAEMQEKSNHMAVVVDEYGVTVGLVTIEDVAEELLGSISDGPDSPDIEPVGPGRWRVAGSMPVEDLKSELGVPIPDGDWNTAAGLMLGVAGRILGWGESVEVGSFEMTVSEVDGRRITRIDVAKQGGEGGPRVGQATG
jgi:putative hemolysin